MDSNNRKNSYRKDRENSNPSFSSTLLDAIYRSIDETERIPPREEEAELVHYKETMRKKQSSFRADGHSGFKDEIDMANFQRACLIEKWMEKKVSVRRKSTADFERKSRNDDSAAAYYNSSSSSSDSSSGGGFSSSEAESVYGASARSSSCYGYGLHMPKPIRTSLSADQPEKFNKPEKYFNMYDGVYDYKPKSKQESGGFVKTKSRALKIYGDLKKVKQPISPGGRLASFLNSIFSAGNAKKAKISSSSNNIGVGAYDDSTSERKFKSANASTCSSASSFSRSCLSKTPSSRGKSSNGMKRSVRFYPVSVIVDEDCQPCGQKSLYDDKKSCMDFDTVKDNSIRSSVNEELKFHVVEKNRRVEEAARDLLRNFQKKVDQCDQFDMRNARIKSQVFDVHHVVDDEEEEEEEIDDDAASYASSDLFELDNLSAIGMERYSEELPVYETTHLDTNRAIANGLIL